MCFQIFYIFRLFFEAYYTNKLNNYFFIILLNKQQNYLKIVGFSTFIIEKVIFCEEK